MLVVKAKEGLKAHSCTLCNSFCVFSAITTLVVFFLKDIVGLARNQRKNAYLPF